MKNRHALLLAAAVGCGAAVLSSRAQQDPAQNFPDEKKMMEMMQQYAQPGPMHARLADMLGKWDTVTRMTMGPGGESMEDRGEAEFKWLMPDRWLQEEVTGTMMSMPFHGFGITGYDNFKKKYTSAWIDTASTMLLTSEGNFDQSGKNIFMYGSMDEYLTGENDKCVKYVRRFVSKDQMVLEIHDMVIGDQNTKVVEVTYTRKK